MPGKILQNMSKVGVRNPLFLLDEIDKLGMDFRGDPSSALLEVLDPEQNHTFQDHYVEVDFDLSDVMFVATSNTLNIPPALLDRMEVIRLSGYTEDEKVHIASDHLIPKLLKNNGLKEAELMIDESARCGTSCGTTRARPVCARWNARSARSAARWSSSLLTERDAKAKSDANGEAKPIAVTSENLNDYLGVRRFNFGMAEKENQVGQVTGLAWTEGGRRSADHRSCRHAGQGRDPAYGFAGGRDEGIGRSRADRGALPRPPSGFADSVFEKRDMHVHVPEGATPKDGPSAGIAITTAMVSALSGIPVRADVAMTGEITLRGEVLAIGGLKEKLLAAHRGGIKTVLIPEENVKDLAEIPDNVKNQLEVVPVRWIDKVLERALERMPEPISEEEAKDKPLVTPAPTSAAESVDPVIKH